MYVSGEETAEALEIEGVYELITLIALFLLQKLCLSYKYNLYQKH